MKRSLSDNYPTIAKETQTSTPFPGDVWDFLGLTPMDDTWMEERFGMKPNVGRDKIIPIYELKLPFSRIPIRSFVNFRMMEVAKGGKLTQAEKIENYATIDGVVPSGIFSSHYFGVF